ncbi:MAG TPA: hypothetical protein VFI42_14675 [Thermomicrobiaceae bacterium]|nr:hypothetical protein [Thermomicrobiaceae bacterium]
MTLLHLNSAGLTALALLGVVGLGTTLRARVPPPRHLLIVLLLCAACLLEYPPTPRCLLRERGRQLPPESLRPRASEHLARHRAAPPSLTL